MSKYLLILSIIYSTGLYAHRSGCHRWHSCPSDSGSYVCGDKGKCSQCPDNQYCQGGSPAPQHKATVKKIEGSKYERGVIESSGESYSRKLYPHWIDSDKDCQDTRAEILISFSLDKVKFKRTKGYFQTEIANLGRKSGGPSVAKPCNVTRGSWICPYTGATFKKASALDIDHIIPLKHAHLKGANKWSKKKRREFANDPMNLLAVDKKQNRSKGAKGITGYLPPLDTFKCAYVNSWEAIKEKYKLEVSTNESKVIEKIKKKWCN